MNNKTEIEIICNTHGVFKQIPRNHLSGYGCQNCARNEKIDKIEFEKNIIHKNKYNYVLSIINGEKIKQK